MTYNLKLSALLFLILIVRTVSGADAAPPTTMRELIASASQFKAGEERKLLLFSMQFLSQCNPRADDEPERSIIFFKKVIDSTVVLNAGKAQPIGEVQIFSGKTIRYLSQINPIGIEDKIFEYLSTVVSFANMGDRHVASDFLRLMGLCMWDETKKRALMHLIINEKSFQTTNGRAAFENFTTDQLGKAIVWDVLQAQFGTPQEVQSLVRTLRLYPILVKEHLSEIVAGVLDQFEAQKENQTFQSAFVPLIVEVTMPGDLEAFRDRLMKLLTDAKVAYPHKAVIAALFIAGIGNKADLYILSTLRTQLIQEAINWRATRGREQAATSLAYIRDIPILFLLPGPKIKETEIPHMSLDQALRAIVANDVFAQLDRGFLAMCAHVNWGYTAAPDIAQGLGSPFQEYYAIVRILQKRQALDIALLSEEQTQRYVNSNADGLALMQMQPALFGGDTILNNALSNGEGDKVAGLLYTHGATLIKLYGQDTVEAWARQTLGKISDSNIAAVLGLYELGFTFKMAEVLELTSKMLKSIKAPALNIGSFDKMYGVRLMIAYSKIGINQNWVQSSLAELRKKEANKCYVALFSQLEKRAKDLISSGSMVDLVLDSDPSESLLTLGYYFDSQGAIIVNDDYENVRNVVKNTTRGFSGSLRKQLNSLFWLIGFFNVR